MNSENEKLHNYNINSIIFFSCRDTIKSPEIKGHVYNRETLEPISNLTISIWLTDNFGGPIIPKKVVTDSIGGFHIPKRSKKELALPILESADYLLCYDCVVTLEKNGFITDSVFIGNFNPKFLEGYITEIDSLFFTARKVVFEKVFLETY